MSKLFYLLVILSLSVLPVSAQDLPFASEIAEFRQQDSINPPPADPILFVGSSSFRMWDNMQDMFSGNTILNRGFGGSTLADLHRYLPDLVYKYNPKQIVIYSGENDIAANASPDTVYNRFTIIFNLIRSEMPDVPLVYVSIKPSPSRAQYAHLMMATNRRIRDFLKKKKKTAFVDIYSRMIDGTGKARAELFIADNLHMNQEGYKIWQKAIKPHLVKQ